MVIYGITEIELFDNQTVGERLLRGFYTTRDSAKAKGLSVIKQRRETEGFEVENFLKTGLLIMKRDDEMLIYNIHVYDLVD